MKKSIKPVMGKAGAKMSFGPAVKKVVEVMLIMVRKFLSM